ncbi:MAG: 16S rRNA (guanine(966)-N(2))-methyltransferase RsmD [Candidatus Eisenbacteria bacterium]
MAAAAYPAAVRIIGGSHRGRTLRAPHGHATRPTSDRVREALFAILGDVEGLDVLDLFAGSGALGLEALSRGARTATFVEEARAALVALEKNVSELVPGGEATIVRGDARQALKRLAAAKSRRFGLAFLDPPYAATERAAVLADLLAHDLLVPGAWVVVEHATRDESPAAPPPLEHRFDRAYGDTTLAFYRLATEGP